MLRVPTDATRNSVSMYTHHELLQEAQRTGQHICTIRSPIGWLFNYLRTREETEADS